MQDKQFDFEAFKKEAIGKLKSGKGLNGVEGAFTPQVLTIGGNPVHCLVLDSDHDIGGKSK